MMLSDAPITARIPTLEETCSKFPYAAFGAWLRRKRQAAGISSAGAVAKAIGVSLSSVNHWENGRYLPTITPMQTCIYASLLKVLPQDIAAVQEALIHEGGISSKKRL
jgi:transcriptional regulator with XRE-family HTH domain